MLDRLVGGVSTKFLHVLTGVFILASTARTSNALLEWNCEYSLTSNVMYGVLNTSCSLPGDEGLEMVSLRVRSVFGIMASGSGSWRNENARASLT